MNICFVTDDNYVSYTMMCISSICISNTCNVDFYVIGVFNDTKNIQILRSFKHKNNTITVIDVSGYQIKNISNYRHISNTSFLKTQIPYYLNLDKVLLLDGDIIVRKPLDEFWNYNINNFYCAAVKDFGINYIWKNNDIVSIKNKKHFYSGQMLLNINKIKQDNLMDKMMQLKKQHEEYMDQELFNEVMYNNVKFIDIKFCLSYNKILTGKHKEYLDIKLYNELYNSNYNSMEELIDNSVILHFHGDKKEQLENYKIRQIYNYNKENIKLFFDVNNIHENIY